VSEMEENAATSQWAMTSGDVWAQRWRDTDRGLSGLAPQLLSSIVACAPSRPFRAFDVGSGPGSTAIAMTEACPEAEITACDISPALVELARHRTAKMPQIRVVQGDAEALAPREGPFDLIFSRHGVMFFPDPVHAFRALRSAMNTGGYIVFSCFRDWVLNPWASELASVVAGKVVPAPGREPSGFAFADPDYVREILGAAGWMEIEPTAVDFSYVAADGGDAIGRTLSFFAEIGPASRILQSLPEEDRSSAIERMRGVIERHFDGTAVTFPAAAWIWRAKPSAATG